LETETYFIKLIGLLGGIFLYGFSPGLFERGVGRLKGLRFGVELMMRVWGVLAFGVEIATGDFTG